MSKFIQVRGSTETGKTTAVRQFLQITGGFVLHQITVRGKQYPFYHNKEKNIVVTGVYGKRNTDGLDGVITDKDTMFNYLISIVTSVKPETVVFEAVMYGLSFKFANELAEELKKRGYEYIGIVLDPPWQFAYNNIMKRNGGKNINVKSLKAKFVQAQRSADKLKAAGLDIRVVDTSRMRESGLYSLIQEAMA